MSDTIVCMSCAGYGDVFEQVGDGIRSCEARLVTCSRCGGLGHGRPMGKITNRDPKIAMDAAVEAVKEFSAREDKVRKLISPKDSLAQEDEHA